MASKEFIELLDDDCPINIGLCLGSTNVIRIASQAALMLSTTAELPKGIRSKIMTQKGPEVSSVLQNVTRFFTQAFLEDLYQEYRFALEYIEAFPIPQVEQLTTDDVILHHLEKVWKNIKNNATVEIVKCGSIKEYRDTVYYQLLGFIMGKVADVDGYYLPYQSSTAKDPVSRLKFVLKGYSQSTYIKQLLSVVGEPKQTMEDWQLLYIAHASRYVDSALALSKLFKELGVSNRKRVVRDVREAVLDTDNVVTVLRKGITKAIPVIGQLIFLIGDKIAQIKEHTEHRFIRERVDYVILNPNVVDDAKQRLNKMYKNMSGKTDNLPWLHDAATFPTPPVMPEMKQFAFPKNMTWLELQAFIDKNVMKERNTTAGTAMSDIGVMVQISSEQESIMFSSAVTEAIELQGVTLDESEC